MRTAEEILEQHCDSLPAWTGNRKQAVINAINAAQKEAIEECVKKLARKGDQEMILKLIEELK